MSTTPTDPASDIYGRTLPTLTSEQSEAMRGVIAESMATPYGVLSLDMSRAEHRGFVLDQFGGEEFLERYFPSTRNLVELSRQAHEAQGGPTPATLLEMEDPATDAWHPLVNISYVGLEGDGVRLVAQGVVTLPYMASSMTSTMKFVDQGTGGVLGLITVPTQFNLSTQITNLNGILPQTSRAEDVYAVLTVQYLEAGSTQPRQVSATVPLVGPPGAGASDAAQAAQSSELATPIAKVSPTDPNHNSHPDRDFVKVGLNRTPDQVADCDYYYQYGNQGSKPIVGLQVSGSATLIAGYSVAANPAFRGSCVLVRRSGTGGGATLAFPSANIPQACKGSGNAVTWAIGPDWLQGAPWDQGDIVDLDFTLSFAVQPTGTATLRVTSVAQGIGTPPTNLGTVAPIKFVWGCVATGTLVRMADGQRRAIETLCAGERVAGPGRGLRIAEVWRGHEGKPLCRIATASGAEALLTEGHPVPTADGVVAASDLAVGMTVTTEHGPEPLVAVEWVSYDGAVINLDLLPDDAETLADIDNDAITAFEAGGILVGDNRMQGVLNERAAMRAGPSPFVTHGPEWRLDILNSSRIAEGLVPIEQLHA
ncbi:Hint domain-containing protein [Sphingomonas sp. NIBR02145]|uniref:Hint domain-containing protein n=1 Tax=Sphingomonas sp. NIBR02145 TaxID=3014784 RepID=UPI0022B440D2|nr:Hint domain-containing protein [Sphingomonas sp. NIBR02145]WHU04258.1 hypothetical protein O3305_06640 [Sphingomonas sp. NIBR02145]